MRNLFLLCAGLFFLFTRSNAQDRVITGTVRDSLGQPLSGVSIKVTGMRTGTATDGAGAFTLTVPQGARSIEVSSVGYTMQVVGIPSGGSLGITLLQDAGNMNEVVVTGYARQRRSEYSGAASKVTGEQIRNFPVASFDQMLQGRAPGLTVLSGSGQPGSAATLILRGPSSIQGGSAPLFVVDGVAVESGVFQSINPNDIASIDVLKDASAAALYGSRGAAGVIVVTTRRGSGGKMKMGYSGQFGVKGTPVFNYDMMNSAELLKAQEDLGLQIPNSTVSAWQSGGLPTLPGWQYSRLNPNKLSGGVLVPKTAADFDYGDRQLDSLRAINTDWDDLFFRNGNFSNNEISFSGGTGKTRLYSNLGYYSEEGISAPSDMKRVTLRTNMDYSDDQLTFAFSSNLGYTRRNLQANPLQGLIIDPFLAPRTTPPYITARRADGKYNVNAAQPYFGPNMLDAIQYNKVYNDQVKGILGLSLNYNFSKHVYGSALAGIDFRETNNTTYNDPRAFDIASNTNIRTRSGTMIEAINRFLQVNTRASIGYRNTLARLHDMDVNLTAEYLKYYAKTFSAQGFGIDIKRPNTLAAVTAGNGANQLFQAVTGTRSQRAIVSFMGNARYSFNRKYTLTGTYRYDGASNLPEDNRFQGFYAIGAIWDVMRESFMGNSRHINALRLKLSHGQSANADNFPFGDFGYLPTYVQALTPGGTLGITANNAGNPQGDWEYTTTTNLGIEFGLFGNRLSGDVQVYNKVTDNLFARLTLSSTGGFAAQNVNAGSMYNRGIEYAFSYDVIRNRLLTWTVNVNGAYNRNKVTSLGTVTSFERGTELIKVGLPIGSHYEVKWAGVDAATGSPLYFDREGKLTSSYSPNDRVQEFGTWVPPYTGGFGTDLRVKGFSFSAFFNYAAKTYRVNNLEFFMENPGFLQSGFNQARSMNFWKRPGDVASTQSP
ncbi:MAG TPA: SusC/RagA family TonB-linked outer membrane protein, partial [Flavisolibacter sp.]|nr:SusC/RagA family TonB-linked outer membrane protein [Flavisolibacter sp.]